MAWATKCRRGALTSLTVTGIDWPGKERLVFRLRREAY
jgi:hypothetical protein